MILSNEELTRLGEYLESLASPIEEGSNFWHQLTRAWRALEDCTYESRDGIKHWDAALFVAAAAITYGRFMRMRFPK